MSVKQALLALLEQEPMYGYQLRTEFESRTGSAWPLNVGQVYTTLTRLQRDDLVEPAGVDDEGHEMWRLTATGHDEVAAWFTTPVERTQPARDELAIKLALAVTVPGVDVGTLIQQQRSATMRALQDYTRLKRRPDATTHGSDLAWSLVLDSLVFAAEAEIRWLDHCETRVRRAATEVGPVAPDRVAHPPRVHAGAIMSAVLRLQGVTRVHGEGATRVEALRGISFAAHPGELVAVMGPSGSGKSTLLTIAGGLDRPTAGRVEVEGTDLVTLSQAERARKRRTSIGYVFQGLNLIPALTAVENVALPRELDGERTSTARKAALRALEEVGIVDLAHRFPDDMSGGQQQRVAIARAVVGERRLILADEPTGALDSETGEEVLRLLRARCDAGAAGVLVTHEARHAAWADRVVFLRDGIVVDESGSEPVERLLEPSETP